MLLGACRLMFRAPHRLTDRRLARATRARPTTAVRSNVNVADGRSVTCHLSLHLSKRLSPGRTSIDGVAPASLIALLMVDYLAKFWKKVFPALVINERMVVRSGGGLRSIRHTQAGGTRLVLRVAGIYHWTTPDLSADRDESG